jgi:hypothetical protein
MIKEFSYLCCIRNESIIFQCIRHITCLLTGFFLCYLPEKNVECISCLTAALYISFLTAIKQQTERNINPFKPKSKSFCNRPSVSQSCLCVESPSGTHYQNLGRKCDCFLPSVYSYALAHVGSGGYIYDMDWITAHFSFPEDEDGDGPRNFGFIYF